MKKGFLIFIVIFIVTIPLATAITRYIFELNGNCDGIVSEGEDNYNIGFEEGYQFGFEDGTLYGYDDGYNYVPFNPDLYHITESDTPYEEGTQLALGYMDGYNQGVDESYLTGYNEGYDQAELEFQTGYDDGYLVGSMDAIEGLPYNNIASDLTYYGDGYFMGYDEGYLDNETPTIEPMGIIVGSSSLAIGAFGVGYIIHKKRT